MSSLVMYAGALVLFGLGALPVMAQTATRP